MKRHIILAYICLTSGIAAFATPVTPTYTTFGNLDATWGGSGNPHDPVAVTTIVDGNNTITLGLAAQQRYFNPPVGNDSAGTYFATTGANQGGPGNPSSFVGALWNFDFYFDATGGSYTYRLLYGTDASTLISINPAAISDNGATPHAGGGQNSENLLFGNFGGVANTLAFDPNASGIYSFVLEALNVDGRVVGSSAINVSVRSVPDVSSTAGLLGLGVVGLLFVNARRTRLACAK